MVTTESTFFDYADSLDWLSSYFDECYWNDGLDTFACYEAILEAAKDDGVTLTDAETCDYDKILAGFYRDTEKGLS